MKRLITTLLCLVLLMTTVFSLSSCAVLDALPEGIREVIIRIFGIEVDVPEDPENPTEDPTPDDPTVKDPVTPDTPAEPEKKRYSVTISTEDGTDSSVITVVEGDLVTAPATPTRKGYTFLGWYCGDSIWNFDTDKVTAETTIYAKWKLNVYNISYMLDGGSNASLNPGTFDAESGEVTLGVPTKPGYLFCGWYSDPEYKSEIEVINIDIAGDITLYAKWEINVFNISYNLGGDNVTHTNPDKYDINTGDITLGAPEREGYTFLGWYTDPEFTKPITVINVNILDSITIYAEWQINIYNITYELYGGVNAEVNPGTFNAETGTLTLGSASRPGYNFGGWYADPEYTTPITEINILGDIKVYAKWNVKVYNITYNLNGGVNSPDNPTDFDITTGIITLGIPTRGDYVFIGWFTSPDFSESSRITVIDTNILDDITVYAGWLNISDMFEYTVYNTEVTITGYSGNLTELTIPERINGYTVTTIAESAFANNTTIKTLTVPATVKTVKARAFEGCTALENLTVDAVTIEEDAFSGCSAMTSLTIGEQVKTIRNGAFSGAISLTNLYFNATFCTHFGAENRIFERAGASSSGITVLVGKNTAHIPSYFFNPSSDTTLAPSIVELDFADGAICSTIASYAFTGSSTLKTVTLPEFLTLINNAFQKCTALETVYLNSSNLNNAINSNFFSESGCDDGITLYVSRSVNRIPGGFMGASNASHGYTNLKRVVFEENSTLTEIGASAFANTAIEEFDLPASVEVIENYAFYKCQSLKSFSLGEAITKVGGSAFAYCTAMKKLELRGYLSQINNVTFKGLTALEELYFNPTAFPSGSGSTEYLGEIASVSKHLKVTIGNKVTSVPNYLLRSSGNNVYSITFEENSICTSIGEWAFGNANILSIVLPDSLKTIGNYVFAECENLVSITFGTSYTGCSNNTFRSCSKLLEIYNRSATSITPGTGNYSGMPRSGVNIYTDSEGASKMDTVGEFMFFVNGDTVYLVGCTDHTSETIALPTDYRGADYAVYTNALYDYKPYVKALIIPDAITDIEAYAFAGLKNVDYIYFGSTKFVTDTSRNHLFSYIGEYVEGGVRFVIGKYIEVVPDRLLYGSDHTSFSVVEFEDGTMCTTLSDRSISSALIKNLVLPDSVTTVSDNAFESLYSVNSTFEGTLYGNIRYLAKGTNPYYYAIKIADASVTSAMVHKDTKVLSDGLFRDRKDLTEIRLEATALLDKSGYNNTFSNAGTNSTGIVLVIGNTVERIPSYFIATSYSINYPNITSIRFEENGVCTTIAARAMMYLQYVDEITLPDYVKTVEQYAFSNCAARVINTGDGVVTIEDYAFTGCPNAHTIIIGDSVRSIGASAFSGCNSLLHVTLGSSVAEIGDNAFKGLSSGTYSISDYNKIKEICNKSALVLTNGSTSYGAIAYAAINIYTPETGSSKLIFTDDDFIFYDYGDYVTLVGYCGSETELTLPEGFGGAAYAVDSYMLNANKTITKLVIPSKVTAIGAYAFNYMRALTELVIGEDVTALGKMCFAEATKLKSITYLAKNIADINTENPFVRAGSATYTPDMILTVGKDVVRIPARIFYGTSSNLVYIKSVVFEDGCAIKSIGARAFYGVTSLSEIVLPEGLERIEEYAFYSNTGLKMAVIPGSVTYIGQYAFAYCSALQNITILDGAVGRVIENLAFYYNRVLTTVVIGSGVTSIGTEAFATADKLATVILADSVASLGKNVFVSKTALTIYFEGSSDEFNAITKDSADTALSKATVCFYSESTPGAEGNFWHYDEGGNVVIW